MCRVQAALPSVLSARSHSHIHPNSDTPPRQVTTQLRTGPTCFCILLPSFTCDTLCLSASLMKTRDWWKHSDPTAPFSSLATKIAHLLQHESNHTSLPYIIFILVNLHFWDVQMFNNPNRTVISCRGALMIPFLLISVCLFGCLYLDVSTSKGSIS